MLYGLKFTLRRMRRRPVAPIVATALLGVGIGVASGLLSAAAAVLLRPLPFRESENLVQLGAVSLQAGHESKTRYFSHEHFLELAGHSRSFEILAAVKESGKGNVVHLSGVERPRRLRAARVSREFFPCLGAPPAIGRLFGGADEGAPEAILSHRLWKTQFAADPGIVGRKIVLDREPHVVTGVMPAFLDQDGSESIHGGRVDLWLPLSGRWLVPGEIAYRVVGRLRADVSLRAANEELAALGRTESGRALWRGASPRVFSLREEVVESSKRHLHGLSLAGLILLVLAGANCAGLLASRVERRQKERAIQAALGAGRGRLAAESVGEAAVVALAASGLALWVSLATFQAFKRLAPADLPRLSQLEWGWEGAVLTLALALGCGSLLVAALLRRSSPRTWAPALRSEEESPGPRQSRFRSAAIVLETAAAVALLFSAALLYQSFDRLSEVDPGYATAGVVVFDIFLPEANAVSRDPGAAPLFYEAVREQVEGLPGLLDVAFTSSPPLAQRDYHSSGGWRIRRIDDRYFEVLGTRILDGRGLSRNPGGRKEAVASRSLAERLFPGGSAVGARLEGYEIVGVVGDLRHESLDLPPEPALYVSHRAEPDGRMSMMVKTDGDAPALGELVRDRVRLLDPDQPVSEPAPLEETARQSTAVAYRRLFLVLLGAFSIASLALSATGFYGLIAQSVQRQTKLLAIRMAVGADPSDILILVLGQTWRLVGWGAAAGLAATFWLSELQRSLLYETSPYDFATLLAVLAVVLAVASAGSWIPAARAARLQPSQILRAK